MYFHKYKNSVEIKLSLAELLLRRRDKTVDYCRGPSLFLRSVVSLKCLQHNENTVFNLTIQESKTDVSKQPNPRNQNTTNTSQTPQYKKKSSTASQHLPRREQKANSLTVAYKHWLVNFFGLHSTKAPVEAERCVCSQSFSSPHEHPLVPNTNFIQALATVYTISSAIPTARTHTSHTHIQKLCREERQTCHRLSAIATLKHKRLVTHYLIDNAPHQQDKVHIHVRNNRTHRLMTCRCHRKNSR
jgi:hypothetical protein